MCSLAPRAAAFLDRRRGVAAVAPAYHRADDAEMSTARPPAQTKRGRHDDFQVHPAPPSSAALRVRMDKELVALQGLVKRAKLLLPRSGSAPPAAAVKKCGPTSPQRRRSEASAPVVSSSAAAARRTTTTTTASQPKAATEAAYLQKNQITAPAAASSKQQQQRTVQHQSAADKKKTEVPKKRRRAEEEEEELIARAAAREEFRRMLLEMEKTALPDETIYPEDLQELGIAFEHVATRTRKEAWLEDHVQPLTCRPEFVGVY